MGRVIIGHLVPRRRRGRRPRRPCFRRYTGGIIFPSFFLLRLLLPRSRRSRTRSLPIPRRLAVGPLGRLAVGRRAVARPEPRVDVRGVPRRGPTPGGPRSLLVVGGGRPPGRDVRVLVVLGVLRLRPPRAPVPSGGRPGGARPVSTTVALLGLGHLAGVLGRLDAAALVAPEGAHVVVACVSAPSQRRRRAARCLPAVDAP